MVDLDRPGEEKVEFVGHVALSADHLARPVVRRANLLVERGELFGAVLDLIAAYEDGPYGPLFVAPRGPFARVGAHDGSCLDRAMLSIFQVVLDRVYNGGVLADCSRLLFDGRGWRTAMHFPGALAPPANASAVHTVAIDASAPAVWGRPMAFAPSATRAATR